MLVVVRLQSGSNSPTIENGGLLQNNVSGFEVYGRYPVNTPSLLCILALGKNAEEKYYELSV